MITSSGKTRLWCCRRRNELWGELSEMMKG